MENFVKLPSMSFGESVKSVLNNLLNFNGRARRSELWWYWALYIVVSMVVGLLIQGSVIVAEIVSQLLQLTLWSVTVRRIHDRGQNGWWVTAAILISVFNSFYLAGSGFFEAMNAANPDIDAVMSYFQDPVLILGGLVSFVVNIVILVFCLLDGKPEPNKYGESPKYVINS